MFNKYLPYTRLPTTSEESEKPSRFSRSCLRSLCRPRILLVLVLIALCGSLFFFSPFIKSYEHSSQTDPPLSSPTNTPIDSPELIKPPELITSFGNETRPAWLDLPPVEIPLIFRVAVLSHPKEVDRRQLIRDNIFKGVRPSEISIEYRFIVGLPDGGSKTSLEAEQEKHEDLVIWERVESYQTLSQKRYFSLKWAESLSNASYDYFMSMDSDTFVRFGALARRLPTVLEGKNINPREDPVIVARMSPHWWHWVGTVSDENDETTEEDLRLDGPWYSYPIGIGYMLSSYLMKQLLSTHPPLPHHIPYPCDDVMIGAWISSLSVFADPQHTFRTAKVHPWNVEVGIRPDPILPHPVNTIVVDDHGWHDYKGRANYEDIGGAVGWNSVCVHHIKENEIKILREVKEYQGEWD